MVEQAAICKVETPAMVFDVAEAKRCARRVRSIVRQSGARLLYAVKACHAVPLLKVLSEFVDGFSTSSVFEAMLSRRFCAPQQSIHITSPGLREKEFEKTVSVCDFVSFNSVGQLRRMRELAINESEIGLRINPGLSFLSDDRYDPCRSNSKLGVPLEELSRLMSETPTVLDAISGVHFHNNCDSTDFNELFDTVEHLDTVIGPLLSRVEWINIGGGYLFNAADSLAPFFRAVDLLRTKYGLTVFVEPGAAIVRSAGSLVSTVLDMFESDGKTVAILDTTVNHMPEVFEYQFSPDVLGATDDGEFKVILAGCSCLAGDVFGEFAFEKPITIGTRVVFQNMGAYTVPKWHMFNGINLPSIYAITEDGQIILQKQFTYADFAARNGVPAHAVV